MAPAAVDPIMYEVGRFMQKRRVKLGLTQEELAERAGQNPRTIVRWEAGIASPRMRDWISWCQALRLDWWPMEPGGF